MINLSLIYSNLNIGSVIIFSIHSHNDLNNSILSISTYIILSFIVFFFNLTFSYSISLFQDIFDILSESSTLFDVDIFVFIISSFKGIYVILIVP